MNLKIWYQNDTPLQLRGYQKRFLSFGKALLENEHREGNYEVSITITDDETIRKYNDQYRGINRPTDVISFAFDDIEDVIDYDDVVPHQLGDIIISHPTAKLQAKQYGHRLERELCFLFVHGFLHLLGYDHQNKEDERVMFDKQEELLNRFGLNR
jgi:probable rRNA maturation factor